MKLTSTILISLFLSTASLASGVGGGGGGWKPGLNALALSKDNQSTTRSFVYQIEQNDQFVSFALGQTNNNKWTVEDFKVDRPSLELNQELLKALIQSSVDNQWTEIKN